MNHISKMLVAFIFIIFNSHALIHKIPSSSKVIERIDGTSCTTCKTPDRFSVTVWNMYKGKKDSWQRDFEELYAKSDIFLTQEFYLKGAMKSTLQSLEETDAIYATSFINMRKYKTGVATFSKTRSTSHKYFRTKHREPFVLTPKLSLLTQYDSDSGVPITLINIHAINFVSTRKLKHQLTKVTKYIEGIETPVIFAGDFNTNIKKKRTMMRKLLKAHGFTEAKFSNKDDRMEFAGMKLDYIWYRNVELIDAKVLGHINGSDHKPLYATFEIR